METVTFLIYLDAFCNDYVTDKNTPFLYELSKKGYFGKVQTVSGFAQEAAIMTGKYPDKTDSFTWYRYSPENSPFRWLRPFRFFKILRRFRVYYPIKVAIRKITGFVTHREYQDPAFIPLDILVLFENASVSLPKHLPTLASLCQLSKRKCQELTMVYKSIGSQRCPTLFKPILDSIEDRRPCDVCIVHIGEFDSLGHRFGPHPERFEDYLNEVDSWIHKLYYSAKQTGLNCNLVITADHAMFDVKGMIDIESELKRIPLRVFDDYVYFLDSTIARFWFFSDRAKHLVEKKLSEIRHGHTLSQKEKEEQHISFKNNTYGDLLFWVDKGYMIFPNFFQAIASEQLNGMHGYLNDHDGALIVYSDKQNAKQIVGKAIVPLVEVFDITRTLAGI